MRSGPDQLQVFVHKTKQLLHARLKCILHPVAFKIQAGIYEFKSDAGGTVAQFVTVFIHSLAEIVDILPQRIEVILGRRDVHRRCDCFCPAVLIQRNGPEIIQIPHKLAQIVASIPL